MVLLGGGDSVSGQLALRGEAPVSRTLAPTAVMSIQRKPDGKVVFRDVVLSAGWRVVERDTLTVVVRPGLRLPTGGLAEGLAFTPLSTASVDPWLSAEVVAGGAWVGAAAVQVQAPLYAGWDDVRQGPYLRTDVRGARRVGSGVLWLGSSAVGRLDDSRGAQSFAEIAGTAGLVWEVHSRWSVGGQVRVPVWTSPSRPYDVGAGLGVTTVLGKPRDDDGDDHDDGDVQGAEGKHDGEHGD